MQEQKWIIYWNEYTSDTYLYGSKIVMNDKKDIYFENNLMPAGTIIKTWYSKTNYQASKIEPALPMIDGEVEYQISTNIDCISGGNLIVRLEFFDKFDEKAGFLIVKDKKMRFRCPLKTFSYRMQLMNAGASSFRFHYITIEEVNSYDK